MNATRPSFSLTGHSVEFDPRVQAVRPDLADVTLASTLFAPHYAQAVERTVIVDSTPLFDKPNGELASELLKGERFWLLDQTGGWAWGWCGHDHYVGYLPADRLGPVDGAARVEAAGDPVERAQAFIGLPYIWGGRGGAGIDCSGVIQRALAAADIAAPRDSDMQREALGTSLPDDAPLARGDLVFFPGHVGMMADADTLIHATRHHGTTVEEPLAAVIARIEAEHSVAVLARKRVGA
jgi:cell wall-associated NlpC family hydrolase